MCAHVCMRGATCSSSCLLWPPASSDGPLVCSSSIILVLKLIPQGRNWTFECMYSSTLKAQNTAWEWSAAWEIERACRFPFQLAVLRRLNCIKQRVFTLLLYLPRKYLACVSFSLPRKYLASMSLFSRISIWHACRSFRRLSIWHGCRSFCRISIWHACRSFLRRKYLAFVSLFCRVSI